MFWICVHVLPFTGPDLLLKTKLGPVGIKDPVWIQSGPARAQTGLVWPVWAQARPVWVQPVPFVQKLGLRRPAWAD